MTDSETTPRLAGKEIAVTLDGARLFGELDIAIEPGTSTAIIGPNGAGKSTLLRALARLTPVTSGTVLLDGVDIRTVSPRDVGRALGMLSQSSEPPSGFTVRQVVEQGRYPHRGLLGMLRTSDSRLIDQALRDTGTEHLASRSISSLSGGERQRAWLALTLVQEPDILLLDEPTTFLDIAHQLEILELITDLNRARGITVVTVLHDLNHAARYADRVIVLDGGTIVADGAPLAVVSSALIADVFKVESTVTIDPVSGRPSAVFHRSLGTIER
jgi:iron complex transport system ATP-binding protein